ncbi:hypothetical protein [Salibacterium halotolerans]|uniref:Uncharacterized protein n=1 Tax=Salibacterium halotolerans TaxID=1884432 RepID=A0A1I5S6D6_9BACI|nr:hypothetical protein [Salibacterium halotolerans]SFP66231.1 hypothetical protein SAMN05518683_10865 [Salibacterium halotolerans]
MKKLEGREADIFKEMIQDEASVLELDGKKFRVALIEEAATSVQHDVEKYPFLKHKLQHAKDNIRNDETYSGNDVCDMIRKGEL